jgi:hypothetical protein
MALKQPFLTRSPRTPWGPWIGFRGPVNLDGKRNNISVILTHMYLKFRFWFNNKFRQQSNLWLLYSKKCLTALNLTTPILLIYVHFSEKGVRRFHRTLRGAHGISKVKSACIRTVLTQTHTSTIAQCFMPFLEHCTNHFVLQQGGGCCNEQHFHSWVFHPVVH